MLHAVEGLSVGEIARLTGEAEEDVQRQLGMARQLLHDKVRQLGLEPDEQRAIALFGVAPDVKVPELYRRPSA